MQISYLETCWLNYGYWLLLIAQFMPHKSTINNHIHTLKASHYQLKIFTKFNEYISKSYVHRCANVKPLCEIMAFRSPTNHPVAWILSLSNHFKFRYLKKKKLYRERNSTDWKLLLVWFEIQQTDFIHTDRIKLQRMKWDKCVVLEDDDHIQKIKHKHSPCRSFLTDIPAKVLKESCISIL